MVANQQALEEDDHKPRKLTARHRARQATYAATHLIALAIAWVEIWVFLILALTFSWWFLLGPLVFLKVHGYRQELAKNRDQTILHAVRYDWQCHGLGRWQLPKLTGIELGDFVGVRQWAHLLVLNRTWRVIPYTSMAVTIRRADSKGQPSDLESFAQWAKRHYRYQSVTTDSDPADANRDIVVLSNYTMPDVHVAR